MDKLTKDRMTKRLFEVRDTIGEALEELDNISVNQISENVYAIDRLTGAAIKISFEIVERNGD